MPDRPQASNGATVTTPASAEMVNLLGGYRHDDVTFNRDELETLRTLYGYHPEQPRIRPPEPERKPDPPNLLSYEKQKADEAYERAVKQWERWEDPSLMMQAGADRNMTRFAAQDGLRIIAWLAKHVDPGEDPLKTVIGFAVESGYDVNPADVDYAEEPGGVG